jgi:phenylalanyl-tRNA synthetase beta chain
MGWFGQLHPRLATERKLKETVLIGELYLDRLFFLSLQKPAAREISRFQTVRRDFSLQVPDRVQWAEIDAALTATGVPELIEWTAREIYREHGKTTGGKPGGGEYSLLLGVTFQAADRTLREEELQSFSQRIVEAVSAVGARLRT